ncbi:MarR family winged helix-turn-helix transcriptional regulator [Epilithonimonas sp. JDS]|uniref:MarR family winged helix-turn-helix transcriptional regulator n=1 Tax=Epilithonimonas sp. JDS TaxID=2902797 RepID=UPI001E5D0134|nr:MarR family winged helix-turn-helix transcriptional regulator [Epilithonimonas sp. JDS]MCD9855709.1 MarR family winged helix-turn-helix transcriptional regulator [Epilithonimonas sp. JDS]
MNINLVKNVIQLLEDFDLQNKNQTYTSNIEGFKNWISDQNNITSEEPIWEGKENGRSPEGVISTLLVHLNRYAKTYSKSAIADSDFHTQDEFSYLINLKAFDSMTKMELIKKNIQDKSSGILIINRLIKQGWIEQSNSEIDKRSKVLKITESGKLALENQMEKIRNASNIVTGNLTHSEKMELIRILDKLDKFHQPIFAKNIESPKLIETVYQEFAFGKN